MDKRGRSKALREVQRLMKAGKEDETLKAVDTDELLALIQSELETANRGTVYYQALTSFLEASRVCELLLREVRQFEESPAGIDVTETSPYRTELSARVTKAIMDIREEMNLGMSSANLAAISDLLLGALANLVIIKTTYGADGEIH